VIDRELLNASFDAVVEQQGQCAHADERAFRSAAMVDRADASDALQLHFGVVPDMGLSACPGATSLRTTDSRVRRPGAPVDRPHLHRRMMIAL